MRADECGAGACSARCVSIGTEDPDHTRPPTPQLLSPAGSATSVCHSTHASHFAVVCESGGARCVQLPWLLLPGGVQGCGLRVRGAEFEVVSQVLELMMRGSG